MQNLDNDQSDQETHVDRLSEMEPAKASNCEGANTATTTLSSGSRATRKSAELPNQETIQVPTSSVASNIATTMPGAHPGTGSIRKKGLARGSTNVPASTGALAAPSSIATAPGAHAASNTTKPPATPAKAGLRRPQDSSTTSTLVPGATPWDPGANTTKPGEQSTRLPTRPSSKAGLRRPAEDTASTSLGAHSSGNTVSARPATKAGLRRQGYETAGQTVRNDGNDTANGPPQPTISPVLDDHRQLADLAPTAPDTNDEPQLQSDITASPNDQDSPGVPLSHNAEVPAGPVSSAINLDVQHAQEGLVVANPVQEENLPQADTMDLASKLAEQKSRHQRDVRRVVVYLLLGIILVLCILLPVIFLVVLPTQQEQQGTLFLTIAPSYAPTQDPIWLQLQALLPDYTWNSIEQDEFSPQASAYQWIVKDMNAAQYPDWRIVQRFALATLYFATGGDTWVNNGGWLNHSVHGCNWYSRGYQYLSIQTALFSSENISTPTCGNSANNSGPEEMYQALLLHSNGLEGTLPVELYLLRNLTTLDLNRNRGLQGSQLSTFIGKLQSLERLRLPLIGLVRSIPTEIGHCSNMESLELNSNTLVGSIPFEIGSFHNLTSLSLDENKLTGPIPSSLGGLIHLDSLSLHVNRLSGSLPSEIGQLNISMLSMGENVITGTLPSELGQLFSLHFLEGNDNEQLTGPLPSQLGLLSKLQVVLFMGCSLTGSLPSEITLLENLVNFGLAYNHITGVIPTEVGQMSSLKLLYLSGGLLTGPLPSQISSMGNKSNVTLFDPSCTPEDLGLTSEDYMVKDGYVSVVDNMLSGSLPSELGLMTHMTDLELGRNYFSGSIPTELGNLQRLINLDLFENRLTGPIPPQLGLLTKLQELRLFCNALNSTIPFELFELSALKTMFLSGNQFRGTLSSQLGLLRNMEVFAVGGSKLTSTLPTEIGMLSKLNRIDIYDTSINGTLPSELGQITNLQSIILQDNSLSGKIPLELGALTLLQGLSLFGNKLTGTLPPELSSLSALEQLSLGANQFTGTLPPPWGEGLGKLAMLAVRNNLLSGTFPENWGAGLSTLELLRLDQNRFTGDIPDSLEQLATAGTLQTLNLTFNYFLGQVPSGFCSLADLLFDCSSDLCGCHCECNSSQRLV